MFKHLCCKVSNECWHNSTPERIAEIIAEGKAKRKAEEQEFWDKIKKEDPNYKPFDMKEWYKRTGRSHD